MVFRGHSPAADDALETSRPAPRCHRAGETACPDALPIVALETLGGAARPGVGGSGRPPNCGVGSRAPPPPPPHAGEPRRRAERKVSWRWRRERAQMTIWRSVHRFFFNEE
jgi:hypothetical protein